MKDGAYAFVSGGAKSDTDMYLTCPVVYKRFWFRTMCW